MAKYDLVYKEFMPGTEAFNIHVKLCVHAKGCYQAILKSVMLSLYGMVDKYTK